MIKIVKKGERLRIELIRITDDGRGVGFSNDGFLVIIEDVRDTDTGAMVEITQVLEETAFAKRIGTATVEKKQIKQKGIVDSPYEIDEDDNGNQS